MKNDKIINKCAICKSDSLELVVSLPNYPMNTVYLKSKDNESKFGTKNMRLFCCPICKHFQAISDLTPKDLYNDDYQYFTKNPGVQGRIKFFLKQLEPLRHIRFNRIIDIGCFDLSLLKEVKKEFFANTFIGIDPSIPKNLVDNTDGIMCYKNYTDNIKLPDSKSDLPDLIISDQTFEHIPEIDKSLKSFTSQLNENLYFAVCVPSLEVLIEKLNFHNLIHEHVNYFSIHTLTRLFENSSLFLNSYTIEYKTSCGFLFAIYSSKSNLPKNHSIQLLVDNIYTREYFLRYYECFKNMLSICKKILSEEKEAAIYGFGASDITANLAYFMDSDFSMLDVILDETEYKKNTYYPFLKPMIANPKDYIVKKGAVCLITAPQAARYIYNKLIDFEFKKIINPLGVIS